MGTMIRPSLLTLLDDRSLDRRFSLRHNLDAVAFLLLRRPMLFVTGVALVSPRNGNGSAHIDMASVAPAMDCAIPGHISIDVASRPAPAASLHKHLVAALARDDIWSRLEAHGISVDATEARIAALAERAVNELSNSLGSTASDAIDPGRRALIGCGPHTVATVLFMPLAAIYTIFGLPNENLGPSAKA